MDRWTERQIIRQKDEQMDRQNESWSNGQKAERSNNREIGKQTDGHTNR